MSQAATSYSDVDARLQPVLHAEGALPATETTGEHAVASGMPAVDAPRTSRYNPLMDEPHPTVVAAVSRFGFAGLIVSAVVSALLRATRPRLQRLFSARR